MSVPKIEIPWHKSINLINWHSIQRYERQCISLGLVEPLNISIIISCCTIVEGFLNSTLKDHLFILDTKANPEVDINGITKIPLESKEYDLIKRVLDDYIVSLQRGKFNNYIKVFKILTDIDVKQKVSNQIFEAIDKMFQLRNQLTHGAEITYEQIVDKKSGLKIQTPIGKFKSVAEFLKKSPNTIDLMENDKENLLKNEVANFFHDVSIRFIKTLNNSLPQSKRTISPEKLNQILVGKIAYRD